jgi:hypothetical protein
LSERPQFLAADREGQSTTRPALDPDVAAHHLTEVRLMATPRPVPLYWAPWPKFGKIPGTVHSPTQPPANRGVKRPNVWTPLRRRQHELKSRAPPVLRLAHKRPPCNSTIRGLIDSPITPKTVQKLQMALHAKAKPVPRGFVVKKASKMRSLSSGSPVPVSVTEMTCSPSFPPDRLPWAVRNKRWRPDLPLLRPGPGRRGDG